MEWFHFARHRRLLLVLMPKMARRANAISCSQQTVTAIWHQANVAIIAPGIDAFCTSAEKGRSSSLNNEVTIHGYGN